MVRVDLDGTAQLGVGTWDRMRRKTDTVRVVVGVRAQAPVAHREETIDTIRTVKRPFASNSKCLGIHPSIFLSRMNVPDETKKGRSQDRRAGFLLLRYRKSTTSRLDSR